MLGKLIFINGITSTGKTTIGKLLVVQQQLKNSFLIDQDSFYKHNKPLITLTDSENQKFTTSNWDCDEAIDFTSLNITIKCKLAQYDYVIVTGFALKSNLITIIPDFSFLLTHSNNSIELTADFIQQNIIETRRQSKGFKGLKADRDEIMVKNVIWPYYLETLTNLYNYHIIAVYRDNKRIDKTIILKQILDIVS